MVSSILIALLLVFAMIRLGVFGITAYNVIRFMVGSLAYPFMLAILVYLFSLSGYAREMVLLLGLSLFL